MRHLIPDEYRPLARMIIGVTFFAILMVGTLVYLDRITGFASRLIGILSPFLVGGALAFIQMPIARRIELFLTKTLFRRSLKTRAPRVISAIVSILAVIFGIYIFMSILIYYLHFSDHYLFFYEF